jgi:hypothetical protein
VSSDQVSQEWDQSGNQQVLIFSPKNNERPETLSSPGRPGSPPPELLTEESKRLTASCLWHLCAIGDRQGASYASY